ELRSFGVLLSITWTPGLIVAVIVTSIGLDVGVTWTFEGASSPGSSLPLLFESCGESASEPAICVAGIVMPASSRLRWIAAVAPDSFSFAPVVMVTPGARYGLRSEEHTSE